MMLARIGQLQLPDLPVIQGLRDLGAKKASSRLRNIVGVTIGFMEGRDGIGSEARL